MEEDKLIEKNGKLYATLPDGTEALIENEILKDPNWITVHQAEELLKRGDRQIRNLATKNSWDKKYAYVNKKPVRYYYKPQLENYLKSRVFEATIVPSEPVSEKKQNGTKIGEDPTTETIGKSLVSKTTIQEFDIILKKIEPYVGDFLETYKKNQERIVSLEEKKGTAEKKAVFWKTSAAWLIAFGSIALLAWYRVDKINANLTQSTSNLSGKYESTQKELFETKLILNQKNQELEIIKMTQSSIKPNDDTAPKTDE